ncbi:MAG: hypothetical protein HY321_20715 [Armatimonadetes bacterium]|nr:hypothetical protein [Armatimonadota bacterium]
MTKWLIPPLLIVAVLEYYVYVRGFLRDLRGLSDPRSPGWTLVEIVPLVTILMAVVSTVCLWWILSHGGLPVPGVIVRVLGNLIAIPVASWCGGVFAFVMALWLIGERDLGRVGEALWGVGNVLAIVGASLVPMAVVLRFTSLPGSASTILSSAVATRWLIPLLLVGAVLEYYILVRAILRDQREHSLGWDAFDIFPLAGILVGLGSSLCLWWILSHRGFSTPDVIIRVLVNLIAGPFAVSFGMQLALVTPPGLPASAVAAVVAPLVPAAVILCLTSHPR